MCFDVSNHSFPDEVYDLAVLSTILDHLDVDNQVKVISNVHSALKPGGILFANVYTLEDPGYKRKNKQIKEAVSDTSFGI